MKKHVYEPIDRRYSTLEENMRTLLLESDFYKQIHSEKLFEELDFLGIELPDNLFLGEKYFLFKDMITQFDYCVECCRIESGEKIYHFIIIVYPDTVYDSTYADWRFVHDKW